MTADMRPPASVPQAPSIAQSMTGGSNHRDWKQLSYLTIASLVLHLLALGAIGCFVISSPDWVEEFVTTIDDDEGTVEPIVEHSMVSIDHTPDVASNELLPRAESTEIQFEKKGPISLNFNDLAPQMKAGVSEANPNIPATSSEQLGIADIQFGHEMSGRMSAKTKKALVKQFGGNSASEAAVVSGLNWLASHQMPNGSWSFDHAKHPDCRGRCSQSGTINNCPNGATAMALLTFLGAGHTQHSGDYQIQVSRAIDFLKKNARPSTYPMGLDFRGFSDNRADKMYVQGLCGIALCECYAMSNDSRLKEFAQGAIDFIVNSQNSTDGGWRYEPGQRGDTSVVGFQMMALKSAANAQIKVPTTAFQGVEVFLDSVQVERGIQYAYHPDKNLHGTESMTAVGLLCRMYLGWNRRTPQLALGVEYLDGVRPQPRNMYFNYYATQVMHHWGGEEWSRWNQPMRDYLIRTQHPARSGHFAGSWDVEDPHGDAGGRLYMTCLATMTLEIYYRHLPLYDREKLRVDF